MNSALPMTTAFLVRSLCAAEVMAGGGDAFVLRISAQYSHHSWRVSEVKPSFLPSSEKKVCPFWRANTSKHWRVEPPPSSTPYVLPPLFL